MSGNACFWCGCNLENLNFMENSWMRYCPCCGAAVEEEQQDNLHHLVTDSDIDDHVRGNLLDMLDNWSGGLNADELAERAWESENCSGGVFYSNLAADNFVRRHLHWINDAFEFVCNMYGDVRYAEMRATCEDTFLVIAFIEATRIYLYDQLQISQDEGKLSKKRIRAIIKRIKNTPYQAEW